MEPDCNLMAIKMQCLVTSKFRGVKGITVGDVPKNRWACRVNFPEKGYPFAAVSCCCPPGVYDAYRYETVLIGATGKPIYIEALDYEDVQRFKTVDELVKELKRLYDTASEAK